MAELLSIRLAVFTASPNKQYRGLRLPTTSATTLKNKFVSLNVESDVVQSFVWCVPSGMKSDSKVDSSLGWVVFVNQRFVGSFERIDGKTSNALTVVV